MELLLTGLVGMVFDPIKILVMAPLGWFARRYWVVALATAAYGALGAVLAQATGHDMIEGAAKGLFGAAVSGFGACALARLDWSMKV